MPAAVTSSIRELGMTAVLVLLNLVPLVGIVLGKWQTFDLVLLYWMENLVIGFFALLRLLARPYGHLLELVYPLFFAPFFALHYGFFCFLHGSFVIALFGDEQPGFGSERLNDAILEALSSPAMVTALIALTAIQLLDWLEEGFRRGFGCENVKDLMTKPYRRIVVLHLTIIGSAFALVALDDPIAGLLLLVLLKTASDVCHHRRERRRENRDANFRFTPEHLAEMQEKFPKPLVKVNGRERQFESFAELKQSKEFRLAQAVMRLLGAGEERKAINAYLDMKIEEERRGADDSSYTAAIN